MKVLVISIAVIILGAIASVLFIHDYNQKQYEQYVSDSINNIELWSVQFNSTQDRAHKVSLYHGLASNHRDYSNMESNNNEVMKKFTNTLAMMEDDFYSFYYDEISILITWEIGVQDISDKLEAFNFFKSLIVSDDVLNGSDSRLTQLIDRADEYIGFYTETIDWLDIIGDIIEQFDSVDRNDKFEIYIETVTMQAEYESGSFQSPFVSAELDSIIKVMQSWFFGWYSDRIEELSIYMLDVYDDFENIEEIQRFYPFIEALIELNNLIDLFNSEYDSLFASTEIDILLSKIDGAMHDNLAALETLGVEMINDKSFRNAATEVAVEFFNESFVEWKENHRDNEHLPSFVGIWQSAIERGQAEHNRILEAERAAAAAARAAQQAGRNQDSSGGDGSGGNSGGGSTGGGGGGNSGGGSTGGGSSDGGGGLSEREPIQRSSPCLFCPSISIWGIWYCFC